MIPLDENNAKQGFTETEKRLLSGLSGKVAKKHGCSTTYVQHIIKGKRDIKTEKAQKIVKDLRDLIAFFRPEE